MLHKPVVSVCIAAYNAGKYITAALDSLADQSYPLLEVVVVNDGSSDNTLQVLQSYTRRPITIIDSNNGGQCAALNKAFRASTGTLVKFMDSDDLISPRFIENQVKRLAGRTDAVASASWGRFYADDLSTFRLNWEKVWCDMKPIDWLVESNAEGPNMMQCALWLIPRNLLDEAGLWDESLSLINDFEFFIRLLLHCREILFTEDAILYYRSGLNNSLSRQTSRKAFESAYRSTTLGIQHMLAFENSERVRKVSADLLQMWKYDFYPRHRDLYEAAEEQIRSLGGSDRRADVGGLTKKLSDVLGWKTAKRIKLILGK
jgi:glycosyltransferase involved in cell wall biosynthesis